MNRSALHRWLPRLFGARGYQWIQERVRQVNSLSPGHLRRRRQFHRLNRHAAGTEVVLRPGLVIQLSRASREDAEWFSFRSAEMAAEFDSFLHETVDRHRLLDVGAFHALFSLAFARRPDTEAVAIEPSPPAYAVLGDNLRLNPDSRIRALEIAAGAAEGSLRMESNWLHLRALAPGMQSSTAVEIPVRRVDDICDSLGFEPDAIKIDVEGFETDVLAGAQSVLRRFRPILFLEVHPPFIAALGRSLMEVWVVLNAAGYSVFDRRGRQITREAFVKLDGFPRLICKPSTT